MNKIMTAIAAATSFAAASVAFSLSAHAGEVLDRVLAKKKLTVATSVGWPPASFVNDKGELDGYDVEVAKGIAKYLGAEAQFVTPAWNIVTAGKWEGRWDITMGQMVPTKARAEKFDFPAVYFYYKTVAVVHKDSKAAKPSDLGGKVIGVTSGGSEESYANHTFEMLDGSPVKYEFTPGQVKTYEGSGPNPWDDLRLGEGVRLDGILTDEMLAGNQIKAGYPFKILEPALVVTPGAIA
ncbi:transporter substrate-binding domain-containing protein, partial [Rhizobium tibeticum]